MAKLFFTQADFGTTSISCFFSKETFEAATARKNETFNSAMNQVSGK